MQMEDLLSGVPVAVKDKSITGRIDTEFLRYFRGGRDKPSGDPLSGRTDVVDRRNMFYGNNKHMDRGLRFNIPEGNYFIIPVNELYRYYP